jgi:hypothetical protein
MARGMPIAGILLSFIFDLLAYGGFQKRKGAKRLYASLFQLSNKSVSERRKNTDAGAGLLRAEGKGESFDEMIRISFFAKVWHHSRETED